MVIGQPISNVASLHRKFCMTGFHWDYIMTPNKSIQSLFLYGHNDVNFIELRKQATSTRSQSYIWIYNIHEYTTCHIQEEFCLLWRGCLKTLWKQNKKNREKFRIHFVTFDHWHVEIPELQTFVHFIRHTRGTMLSAVDFYNRCLVALRISF